MIEAVVFDLDGVNTGEPMVPPCTPSFSCVARVSASLSYGRMNRPTADDQVAEVSALRSTE